MLAFWMFHLIKHNKFFLYYAEGKDNHGVVEDHDAEVDTLCYKEIFKQRFHSQITFQFLFIYLFFFGGGGGVGKGLGDYFMGS